MPKKFILTVLLATALFMSVYLIWTTWINPRPSEVANAQTARNIPASVTVVPAALNKDGVPEKLGALALTQTAMGASALVEFAQLHGKGFDLVGGYRASYAGASSQATLWVGQAKDGQAASAMVEQMATKIGAGNQIFKDLQPLDIGGRMLYSASGQGQEHFFYAVNDKIVWVAVDAAQAFDALHSLWSAIK